MIDMNAWQTLSGKELIEAALDTDLHVAVVSSFGAESAVLLDMVAQIDPSVPVIFVDTGRLFSETLTYRDLLIGILGLTNVQTVKAAKLKVDAADPENTLYQYNHDACCKVRKVDPYNNVIANYDVLITGRKQAHGGLRSDLLTVEQSELQIKLNPLANLSLDDIEAIFVARKLLRHPLVDEGYKSIGCDVCTSKAGEGEGVRSGRWAGEEKTECGIHEGYFKDGAGI